MATTRLALQPSAVAKIDLRKDTGRVEDVAAKYNFAEMTGQRGITQLRWATFGEPSQVNSQPHLDSDGDLVGAHNGNVVNNVELRQQFMAEGITVRSQNDGESCVHAVERYINKGYEFIDAIRLAYGDLQGDYAFVIGRINDDKLYAIKKGSGLVVGIGDGFTCLSSDLPSILPLTREIVRIQDGEIITLWPDRVELRSVKDGSVIVRDPETVTETMDAVQKGGYPHFMLKEIHEQPQVARELLHLLDGSPDVRSRARKDADRRASCISSAAGRVTMPAWRARFTLPRSPDVPPSRCWLRSSSRSMPRRSITRTWAYSSVKAARPRMCSMPCRSAKTQGMTAFGLANVIGSTLTKATACTLPLCCGYEISVPATKTFTNQVVTFLYLAYRLAGRDTAELAVIPELMEQDAGDGRPAGGRRLPRQSTHGTTCTAWAMARPMRWRWRGR